MPRSATSFGPFHGSHLKNITTAEAGLVTMTDQPRSKIIEENPIGKGLDAFRTSFNSTCEGRSISCTPDALGQLGHDGNLTQRR
jgi:hypothetical protein